MHYLLFYSAWLLNTRACITNGFEFSRLGTECGSRAKFVRLNQMYKSRWSLKFLFQLNTVQNTIELLFLLAFFFAEFNTTYTHTRPELVLQIYTRLYNDLQEISYKTSIVNPRCTILTVLNLSTAISVSRFQPLFYNVWVGHTKRHC